MKIGKFIPFLSSELKQGEPLTQAKLFSHISATVLAVLFFLVLMQFPLDTINGILTDSVFRLQLPSAPSTQLATIIYDDASSVRYGGISRIPPEELIKTLRAVSEESPLAVVVMASLDTFHYSSIEIESIKKYLDKIPRSYVGYLEPDALGVDAPMALGKIPYLPAYVSQDTFSFGGDSVSRRIMLTVEGIPTVYHHLACDILMGTPNCLLSNIYSEKVGHSTHAYIHWKRPPSIFSFPSQQVAEGNYSKGSFKNRIVLIGSALSVNRERDFVKTPFSRDRQNTTTVEAAAQSINSLITDSALKKLDPWFSWILGLFTAVLTVNIVLWLSPGSGILFVLFEAAVLAVMSAIFLHFSSYCMDLAHPLLIAGVGYYLVIPYRLVDEYRQRWHYQEQSELMAELEALKSNFLSLVSHDLKTPVARIQGNAELAFSEPGNLSQKQNDSLRSILQTTEYLGEYIETVLDLTRIESAQTPLARSTKDINQTIREVIDSKRFLAAEKNITIAPSLEPLFSIRYDIKLIRRVIANLVENAINYSPPNTTITLRSHE